MAKPRARRISATHLGSGGADRRIRVFDATYYLDQNQDVATAGVDPLKHYLIAGAFEARNPNPLFDSAFYLRRNRDVDESNQNPLLHYISHGEAEGRSPAPASIQAGT